MTLQDWIFIAFAIALLLGAEWFLAEKVYRPCFTHELENHRRVFNQECQRLDDRFDSMERFVVERVRVIEVNQNVGVDRMRAVK